MTKPSKTPVELATERFNLIAPLVGDGLDKGHRYDLMHDIAQRGDISVRTVKRYVKAWEEGGFEALKPKQGWEWNNLLPNHLRCNRHKCRTCSLFDKAVLKCC